MNASQACHDSTTRGCWLNPRNATQKVRTAATSSYCKLKAGRRTFVEAKRKANARISETIGIKFEWCDAAARVAGAGVALAGRHRIRSSAATLLHDRGHWKAFKQVNDAIDRVVGGNHRLKWGHSLDCLPQLIKECGWVAVPGYVVHITQDFTTPAGIPLFPFAFTAKKALERYGFKASTATVLVSLNLARAVSVVGAGLILVEVGAVVYSIYLAHSEQRGEGSLKKLTHKLVRFDFPTGTTAKQIAEALHAARRRLIAERRTK